MKFKANYKLESFKLLTYDSLIFINAMLESMYNEIDSITNILKAFRFAMIGMLFALFLLTKKQKYNHFVIAIFLLAVCGVNYVLKNGSIGFFMTVCVFLTCNSIPTNKIAVHTIIASVLSYGFIICSSFCGIIRNLKFERWLSIGIWQGRYVRQGLGFQFPNQIPLMYFYIVGLIVISMKNKMNLTRAAALMGLNILIYIMCNARTPFLLVTIMLVMSLSSNPTLNKLICCSPICGVIGSFGGSIILSLGYKMFGGLTLWLDKVLNSRLSSAYLTFQYWGITLFGSGIEAGTKATGLKNIFSKNFVINVDNGYLIFLLQYGLILSLSLMLILWQFSVKTYKKQDMHVALVLFLIMVSNLIDANFDSFRMWPYMLILASSDNGEPIRQIFAYFRPSRNLKGLRLGRIEQN